MRFLPTFLIFIMTTGLLIAAFASFPVAKAGANLQVISQLAYYRENKSSYNIVGEVQNFGDQTARIDSITATMYNAKNEVVATLKAISNYNLYCLLPGRKTPFFIVCMHYDIPAENYRAFDHYSIKVEYTTIPSPPLGLKILSHKGELMYSNYGSVSGYQINSTVQYTGKEKAYGIVLLATVYDSSGKIIGVSRSNYAYWEDPQTATPAWPKGYNNTFEPNQIGFSEPIWFQELRLVKAFSLEEYWLASSVASYELTGEIPEYMTMDGKVFPYYALDTGQAPTPQPTPSTQPTPSPPLPDNAVKVDRSSVNPVNQIEKVPTDQPHVFEYKNLTLVVETTGAPLTLNLTAAETNSQTLKLFVELEEATRLDVALAREAAIAQQEAMARQALASIGFYMDLEQHSSPNVKATFGLHIDPYALNQELGRPVDASRLSWFYWDTAKQEWGSVLSHLDQDSYLVCETDHFSIWTVAELHFGSHSIIGVPLEYFVITAGIVITLLIVAIIIKKQKRNHSS